jgi:hypothetical protein
LESLGTYRGKLLKALVLLKVNFLTLEALVQLTEVNLLRLKFKALRHSEVNLLRLEFKALGHSEVNLLRLEFKALGHSSIF